MLSQPLQHTPGTFYSYSDFGYDLLARVVEHASELTYEQYVQQNIQKPLGIGRQKLAAELQSDTVNGEVTYYNIPGAPLVPCVFPDITALVPEQYGGHFLEDGDGAGGWVATTVDLTRFLNGTAGIGGGPALLNPQTVALMQVDPKIPNEKGGTYYGLGFNYSPVTGGLKWAKNGGNVGTVSYVVVNPTAGFTWSVVFNGNPTPINVTAGEDTGGTFMGRSSEEWTRPSKKYTTTIQFPPTTCTRTSRARF